MNKDIELEEFSSVFGEKRVKGTLKKMADIEINHCQFNIEKVKETLKPFENRFQMNSDEAWKKYQKGELGDDINIMEWMGLYENYIAFYKQLNRIKNSRTYAELVRSTN